MNLRSSLKVSRGLLPGLIAILLPKCPLCLAAWIAGATGVALPMMLASCIKPLLWIACLLSVVLLLRSIRAS